MTQRVEQYNSIGWTNVQYYRTFSLTFVTIFITNPVYRHLALLPILLTFVVHDRCRMPYKNTYLNYLNIMVSACLVLILGCNAIASMSYIVDITGTPYIFLALDVVDYAELILYAAAPGTFIAWKIWTIIEGIRMKKND